MKRRPPVGYSGLTHLEGWRRRISYVERRQLVLPENQTLRPVEGADADRLLRAVARGDTAAFTSLYDQVIARVHGLTRRILRDPAMAEEVTQEVMVEVWRTAARFDPAKGSATAWIFTIAHRRAVDRVRSEQAHAGRLQRIAPEAEQTGQDELFDETVGRLDRQHVRRCLKTLSDLQREAITLAYYGGFTYREVAQMLGAALPTVKSRMRDGLLRLRDCLGAAVAA